jgi:hypothetical protein
MLKGVIDGKRYLYIPEAAGQLNVCSVTFIWRIKSKNSKFDGYKYVDENITMPPSQP